MDDEIQARDIDSPFRVGGAIMGLFDALLTLKEEGKTISKLLLSVEMLAQVPPDRPQPRPGSQGPSGGVHAMVCDQRSTACRLPWTIARVAAFPPRQRLPHLPVQRYRVLWRRHMCGHASCVLRVGCGVQANSRRGALAAALLPPLHWVMLSSLCVLLLSAFVLFDSDFSNPVAENRAIFAVLSAMLVTIVQVRPPLPTPLRVPGCGAHP